MTSEESADSAVHIARLHTGNVRNSHIHVQMMQTTRAVKYCISVFYLATNTNAQYHHPVTLALIGELSLPTPLKSCLSYLLLLLPTGFHSRHPAGRRTSAFSPVTSKFR